MQAQHEPIVSDHHGEVRSILQQSEEAEKATAYIEDHLEVSFSRCKLLDQVVGSWSAAFRQFLEGAFQDFSRDLSKILTEHWHKLCRTFTKFSSDQDDALIESIAGLCTLTDGFADAAASMTKRTAGCDPPFVSGTHRSDAIVGSPILHRS